MTSLGASARFRTRSVAAINGGILGGGVELALHCDYRVIAEDVRHFASPECLLGFVPAWGATQLAPRIAGPEAAVKLIALNPMRQNKMLNAAQAHELGFVDRVVEPERLIDEAMTIASEQPLREEADLSDLAEAVAKGRRQLDDSLHGAAPAPYRALDLIEGAATWSLEEGYRAEEEALADLLFTPQAQASLYAFDLVERRARRGAGRPAAEPREVTKVGIAGAGLMATQLATLFLRRLGVPVVLRDLEQEIVDRRAGDDSRRPLGGGFTRPARSAAGRLAGRPREGHDLVRGLRGLRLRDRGDLRGARREAAGLPGARGRRAGPSACSPRTPLRSP